MTFAVVPKDVADYASQVADLASQAQKAATYLAEHLDIGYAQGRMFATVVATASQVRDALTPNYASLQALTTNAATELDKASVYYQATDHNTAAALDDSY